MVEGEIEECSKQQRDRHEPDTEAPGTGAAAYSHDLIWCAHAAPGARGQQAPANQRGRVPGSTCSRSLHCPGCGDHPDLENPTIDRYGT